MDTSLIVAGAAVGGNIVLGIGLVVTWSRNGRSQATKYGELQNEVKNVGDEVSGLNTTVKDLDRKVDTFQLSYAEVTGRLDERVHVTERDIKELKKSGA